MEKTSINVRINYFGQLTEITDCATQSYELDNERSTIADVIAQLSNHHPEIKTLSVSAAVNNEMADLQHPITDGDQIDLFPPFAGG